MELKVIYDGPEVNMELDDALSDALLPFGLKRWASGYDLLKDERDLAFDDKEIVPEPGQPTTE